MATSSSDKTHKVAIKVIKKDKLSPEDIKDLHNEVAILNGLDHPNIVKYYETYEAPGYIYLVMELCQGGELLDRMQKKGSEFTERDAAEAIETILRALIHCHENGVVHRDLKPENIMYTKSGEAKLIDFGLAKQTTKKNQSMHTIAGTPYFISPEVLNGNYGKECDIWSLGVILFLMIVGEYPFDGDNRTVVFNKIQKGEFTFPPRIIQKSNPEQLDLIKSMIVVDRKKRISAKDAINHPWIKRMLASEDTGAPLDMEVIKKLAEFRGESKLKKAALNIFIKMLQPKDIESLKKEFQKVDTDSSGCIEIAELEQAIKASNYNISPEELGSMIKELDYMGNKKINYSEFLAATVSIQSFLTADKLLALFKQFDVDNTGTITVQNIKDAFSKLGRQVSDEELNEIMKSHDVSGDKEIDFKEFKEMMMGSGASDLI